MTLTHPAARIEPRPAAVPSRPSRRLVGGLAGIASRYWTVAALIVAWWAWAELNGYNKIVVPTPGAVVAEVVGHTGAYLPDLAATLVTSLAGLVAGMALGALLAVVVWSSRVLAGMATPVAMIMRSVPVVALIPIISTIFGYGWTTVWVITTVVTFFPAFVFVGARLREPPPGTSDVFAVLGASRRTVLVRLLAPHAIPGVLVALRLSASSAVLAAMLAEYLMGVRGLGTVFAQAISFYQVERAWGAALVATVVSVACFVAARATERWGLARFT